jgi:hypothetical protein
MSHGIIITIVTQKLGGSNSVVECQLPKLDVAGSIPVSRSKIFFFEYSLPAKPFIQKRAEAF